MPGTGVDRVRQPVAACAKATTTASKTEDASAKA
eukprot:CAMPEP_0204163346 /NCGR_PEP_ID=MMETSP0361-20130328/36311_1 /ASSEMBLY_ACC=CAM_ASM_000343 /TAXON_ID=268821 /ORGANISM="Scrippsiella Hangoei, Strain SHTV-5" /LENGTH=33 /DNA_ID= /DNA_START= /DNA_END= /DNA_ORIENTATION=